MRYFPLILFTSLFLFFAGVILTRPQTPETLPSALIDRPLPDITLPNLQGKPTELTSLARNKITIVNVFASWCIPCLMEHRFWSQITDQHQVQLIGVGWKDTSEKLAQWLNENTNPYAHVLVDSEGSTTTTLGITGVPESYVIDKQGMIRYKVSMQLTEEIIANEIMPILKQLETTSSSPESRQ